MNIMELGAIGELVGGAAVLVTLVYLALQVRHSVATTRLAASSVVSDGFMRAVSLMGEPEANGVVQKAMSEGVEGLSPQQRFLFASHLYVMYSHFESVFFDTKRGLIEPDGAARSDTLLAWFQSSPAVRAWWHGNLYDSTPEFQAAHLFTPEFRHYVDDSVQLDTTATPGS